MKFKPLEYMEWAKREPGKASLNLCRSGLDDLSIKDLDLDLGALEIRGEHSLGYAPLLEALASRFEVNVENVLPTLGASHGIFYVCAALLGRGDAVLVEKPAYEPLLAVPEALEAEVGRIERRFDNRYQVDLEELKSALTDKTKLIILTNPHNPSGVLLEPANLRGILALAAEKGVYVFIDEIYLGFQEGKEGRSAFSRAPHVISASSLTKVFGLGGLRCGWLLASEELVRRMHIIRDHINVEEVFIGEQISARVIPHLDALYQKARPRIHENQSLVRKFIVGEKRLSWVAPAPGLICFPRVESNLSGDDLARICREKYDTAIVPGCFFEEPRHFRLGCGVSPATLAQGLDNIRKALAQSDGLFIDKERN
jgi:aspartate/methionine/tyrosine aminotransferase